MPNPDFLVKKRAVIGNTLWSQTGKDKTSFRIASNQRALEQRNKGSMTVYPDYDFLKTLARHLNRMEISQNAPTLD